MRTSSPPTWPRRSAPFAFSLLLAATAAAQGSDHLAGVTRNAPFLRQVDHDACALLGQCGLPGMPAASALPTFVGGTAWDPVSGGAWVSTGLLLGRYDDTCAPTCAPAAIPTLAANAFVTGLEVVTDRDELWILDSTGALHQYTNACPPMPMGVCNTGLPLVAGQQATTGLAVDEANGIVFVAYPDFPSATNTIVVSDLAAPCVAISQFTLPLCAGAGFGTVRGLACDWGKSVLYATDGVRTLAVPYTYAAPNVTPLAPTCCPGNPGADPMIGLAVRPGGATTTGAPCASGSCNACPMQHRLGNDPVLGNADFRLRLDGAPAGSFAWCLIGAGPCFVPGVAAAPFCGPVHTVPFLGSLGANPTGGTAACDGMAAFDLALPADPTLAGAVFSSQCLTLCFGGGVFGVAQSNCRSWALQGN